MTNAHFDLSGKLALFTGGNGGIGLGMAEAMARAGANIAICGTNAEKNAAAKARLDAFGVEVEAFEVEIPATSRLAQAPLAEAGLPRGILVAAVQRLAEDEAEGQPSEHPVEEPPGFGLGVLTVALAIGVWFHYRTRAG